MQQPELYRGPSMSGLLAAVRVALGEDAMILEARGPAETGTRDYEILAAPAGWEMTRVSAPANGPRLVALVGPPGAGKTTTLVKLALHPAAFGGTRVGLVNLDTWRAGATEQLETFAAIAELPLEVVYDAADATNALNRLADCDTILIDTPGRGLQGTTDLEWQAALRALAPHEVHLVVPATMRAEYAARTRDRLRRCGLTHAIATMLDELPADANLMELENALRLPMRWTGCGPEVPGDLGGRVPPQRVVRKAGAAA